LDVKFLWYLQAQVVWSLFVCTLFRQGVAPFISFVPIVSFNPLHGGPCRSLSHQVGGLFEKSSIFYVNPSVVLPGVKVGG